MARAVADPVRLAEALGHDFGRPDLLQQALTHRSASPRHNERLEFLGDAIIGSLVADCLFRRFPEADEGQLTRLRASLVRRETLAGIARELDLGRYLHLGEGERKAGGWRRGSILANAIEALFGAVYLDGGWPAAERVAGRLFGPLLEATTLDGIEKDAKTRLQEHLQGRGEELPAYRTVDVTGAAHRQTFTVECAVAGQAPVTASGSSRRKAEQAAAAMLLDSLFGDGR